MHTVIAVDIGGTKIAGAVVRYASCDAPPAVELRRSVATGASRGGSAVLESVLGLVAGLIGEVGRDVAGIGVGTAGIVEPSDGSIRYANDIMPGWAGQPVRARLEGAFGLPVDVLGDVQAHALGEARWGVARDARSCLVVAAGTGLGGALVIDGRVVRGAHGAAGHVGHTLHPDAADEKCACGAAGHVETLASGTAIAARYQGRSVLDELDGALMGGEISRRAEAGEVRAAGVLADAGRVLGESIGSWCNIFDPELVVLSGSVCEAGPAWWGGLDDGFKSQVLAPLVDTPIVRAALGPDAALVGAAESLRMRKE